MDNAVIHDTSSNVSGSADLAQSNRNKFRAVRFGYASAETESAKAPDLLMNAFFDQFAAIDKTIGGEKMLILGPKGSGKSSIGERIRLLAEDKHDMFVTVRHLSTFPYKNFGRIIPGKETNDVRYPQAWDWLLLVTLINSFDQDKAAMEAPTHNLAELTNILIENNLLPAQDLKQLATKSSKKSFRLSVPLPLGALGPGSLEGDYSREQSNDNIADIPVFVELLQNSIAGFRSASRHLLVVDGLDDILVSGGIQVQVLSALVLSAVRLNEMFQRNQVPAHIVILCRTDLFEILPNPNKNKLKQDNAVLLDWYHDPQNPTDSGLIQLANIRSRMAGNGLSDIFSECFPAQIDGHDNRKRLLDLTRHTPRDFLQLLSSIQQFVKPDLEEHYITRSEIVSGERSYSLNYFLPEIKDGLIGFIEQECIDTGVEIMGSMRRREFTLNDFCQHCQDNLGEEQYSGFDARKFIRAMFEVGAVGNKVVRSTTVMYTFKFRNPNASINFSEPIIIHRGLWKAWNLI